MSRSNIKCSVLRKTISSQLKWTPTMTSVEPLAVTLNYKLMVVMLVLFGKSFYLADWCDWALDIIKLITLRHDKLSVTGITVPTVICVDQVLVAHCYQLLPIKNKLNPDFIIYYVELNKQVSDQHCCNWTNLQNTSTWIIKFVSSERSSHWRFHWVRDFAATTSWTCITTSALKWILFFRYHFFSKFWVKITMN